MFRIADRYVLRQVLAPLATALAIGLTMLLAERMVRLLDTTLGKKNSFAVVFEMLAYLAPHYLGLAIPASLFLGLLFGFSRMSKGSEIDAFLSSGIGLHRLAQPVAILSLAFMAASIVTVGWLQPHTRYLYRSVLFNVKNVDVFYLAEEGVFMQAGNRTFILDRLDRKENRFDKIFLFDDNGGDSTETVTAIRGALIDGNNTRTPVLHLETGHVQHRSLESRLERQVHRLAAFQQMVIRHRQRRVLRGARCRATPERHRLRAKRRVVGAAGRCPAGLGHVRRQADAAAQRESPRAGAHDAQRHHTHRLRTAAFRRR